MKYQVSGCVTVIAYTIVEASSEEEAREIAGKRHAELSFNGSGNDAEDVWLIEEADGEPDIQTVSELDED